MCAARTSRNADTDAAFLLRRIAAMPGNDITREAFSDALDAAYVLRPGPATRNTPATPSRSAAFFEGAPVVYRRTPPPSDRPSCAQRWQGHRAASRGCRWLRRRPLNNLARGAMVIRARSLEVFSYADPRDAWLVDDGDGLAFVFMGVVPSAAIRWPTYVGGLTLRNGVPIGYVQSDIVGRSAALSFNTFETFRGGEAAFSFARWLAALKHVYGLHLLQRGALPARWQGQRRGACLGLMVVLRQARLCSA